MMNWNCWDRGGMMGGSGWGLLGLLFFMALIAITLLLVVTLVRQGSWHQHAEMRSPGVPSDRAASILRERYARGELTQEEFERMRQQLE